MVNLQKIFEQDVQFADFCNTNNLTGRIEQLLSQIDWQNPLSAQQTYQQICHLIHSVPGKKPKDDDKKESLQMLYITAEESAFELARRSQRLDIPRQIMILQTNNFEQIEKVLEQNQPQVVIIDSIQTIFSSHLQSAPGSIAQVSTLASQLLAISKSRSISIIVIGHVTKSGDIAGPKTLEHLVDSVILLESAESAAYRTLSFPKHRFGSTNGLLLLKMEETGLQIVTDPSLALLENLETGVGVAYSVAMDKDLPLMVEIQALVSANWALENKENSDGENKKIFGRREAIGLPLAKLNTILAVAEKYLAINLRNNDVYLQISGLPKNIKDDSLDLAILLAILSSVRNLPLNQLVKSKKNTQKITFAGRLTLSGNLRAATNPEVRQQTAQKLGFEYNPSVNNGPLNQLLKNKPV